MPKENVTKKPAARPFDKLRGFIGALGIAFPIFVPLVAFALSRQALEPSLSAYYYTSAGFMFIGAIWAMAFFLLSYQAYGTADKILSALAWLFAVLITLFPTEPPPGYTCPPLSPTAPPCPSAFAQLIGTQLTATLHYAFAISLFVVLGIFSLIMFVRSDDKYINRPIKDTDPKREIRIRKRRRNVVHRICAVLIFAMIVLCPILYAYHLSITGWEALGLWAFGISWLTKGNLIPWLRQV